MISGTVNRRHEAVVRLHIRDSSGEAQDVDAVIDTGFTGSLTLPSTWVSRLGLIRRSRSSALLANGTIVEFDQFVATILWDGKPRRVLVQAVDNAPLLGISLLMNHELQAHFVPGGRVQILPVR